MLLQYIARKGREFIKHKNTGKVRKPKILSEQRGIIFGLVLISDCRLIARTTTNKIVRKCDHSRKTTVL